MIFKKDQKDQVFLVKTKFIFRNGYACGFEDDLDVKWISLGDDLGIGEPKRIWFFGGHLKGGENFILDFFKICKDS